LTLAAERERERDGSTQRSVRAIGPTVFAQRKAALLQSSSAGDNAKVKGENTNQSLSLSIYL